MAEGLASLFERDDVKIKTDQDSFPPEIEEGNIEYKRQLVNISGTRFEHLISQMKWRLQEGNGEAIYEIGVTDCGRLKGLTTNDMEESLNSLEKMASRLGATVTILRDRELSDKRKIAEVLVRKVPENHDFIDIRLSVLGNWGSGKSTLIGVLTHGQLDNADGRARLNLFRHVHEIESGRTSTVSREIFGFDKNGTVLNYATCIVEDILHNATKLITLIDQPGHDKYLKTTMCGLTSQQPDYAILVVSCTTGFTATSQEHLRLALALKLPTLIVLTKSDAVFQKRFDTIIRYMEKILKSPGIKMLPFRINNMDDAILAASSISLKVCPYFTISNVNGCGLEILKKFLFLIQPTFGIKRCFIDASIQHEIDTVYQLPNCGTVVAGTLINGVIKENEQLFLGPDSLGKFHPVSVQSIQRNHVPTLVAMAGQAVSLALGNISLYVRKGMVLLKNPSPICCMEFEANIHVLTVNGKGISKNFQCVVHINNVRQTAIICFCNKKNVLSNQHAIVRFKFVNRPEFLTVGSRLLFREGRTKGTGDVINIVPYNSI